LHKYVLPDKDDQNFIARYLYIQGCKRKIVTMYFAEMRTCTVVLRFPRNEIIYNFCWKRWNCNAYWRSC